MHTVYFHNPGTLDIRGATIIGLSAKDGDSAIGKFGSGLKYSIASILRWGGAITVQTGGEIFEFSTDPIDFRGKAHDQVCMRKRGTTEWQRLGFTTHYGQHWEPWQIFRELYANAKDEGGDVCTSPPNDGTVITVICEKVAECNGERDTIILPTKGKLIDPEDTYGTCVLMCPSNYLYYRNVRVRKFKCLFTWNLFDCVELTEDRSITSTWEYSDAATRAIQASNDYDFINKCLRATEAYFEGGELAYNNYKETTPTFIRAATDLYREKGRRDLPPGVWEILVKHAPELDAPEPVELTAIQQKQLDRAVEMVCRMGLPADQYPISVVNFQKSTLGMWKNGTVFLSPQVFDQGTKQVVSTLYEEVLHATTGLKDLTYEMQTHLFNRIISLYEELLGEAC